MVAPGRVWGYAWLLPGGFGGMRGCSWGACVVAPGGHAWLLRGGVHGFCQGACVVFARGHVWFLPGGMCGFCQGACMVFSRGACMVFPGGSCMVFPRGVCVGYDNMVDEQAVRILLECILATPVCHSVKVEGGVWRAPPWAVTPLDRHPTGQITLPPTDGHCIGRYASYWNAFLFKLKF